MDQPPFTPYAPALEAAGIDSNKILLIYTKTHEEMLWAMERTCKSGSCGAVLVWPDERKLSLKKLAACNWRLNKAPP